MKLLIFASISSLKTLIQLKVFIKSELCLATKESYFIFNGLCYKQIDGEAMGSPLGPFLANAFLSYEKNWLNICPQGFKPIFFSRPYVDEIFMLIKSNGHLKYFQDFLKFLSN